MTKAIRFFAGVAATVLAAIGVAFLYYTTHPKLPGSVTLAGSLIVPLMASPLVWRSASARLFGFGFLAIVSLFAGFVIAVGVFHDGL